MRYDYGSHGLWSWSALIYQICSVCTRAIDLVGRKGEWTAARPVLERWGTVISREKEKEGLMGD